MPFIAILIVAKMYLVVNVLVLNMYLVVNANYLPFVQGLATCGPKAVVPYSYGSSSRNSLVPVRFV